MTQFEMFITLYIMSILLLIMVFVSHCALSKEHCEIKNEIQKLKEIKGDTDRQQEKIEYMQGERETLLEDMQVRNNQVIEQQAEIEKLTINMNAFGLGMKREKERADQIKAEAIKEFADRLRESNHGTLSYCTGWVDFDDIDDLVKEMVGEQE